jgi:dolichyl-phosphate-mannose-protein mannosyltransferase
MTMTAPTGPQNVDNGPKDDSPADERVLSVRLVKSWRDAVAWLTPRLSWNRAALGLFLVIALVVVVTFADYGVTWDEDVHNWYGVFVLDYYLTLFKDGRCLNWLNLYNYGAAFDTIAAALNHVSPFGTYETRHLLNGAFGIVGIVGTWKLGRALGGPRAGFIAALLLLAIPNYYGQMFNNPKDIPFAVGMVWSIYYMVRIVPQLPRPKWSLVAKLGVATGMALGVRVGGLLLFCYLGLLLLCFVVWRAAEAPSARRFFGDSFAAFWRVLLPTIVVAYPVMLLFWPWAQESPIGNPLRSLIFFSHETFPYRTLFAGQYFSAADLPWAYLPTYIVLALPELVLALALAAPVGAVLALRRLPSGKRRDWLLCHGLVAFAIVFPVAYAVEIKAVLFDGMRHFIFLLPLIAVAAALVADHLLDRLARFEYRRPIYAALALYGIGHLSMMAMLHPNEYVYYNGLVGGVEGAQGLFKMDYWANSYAEAVDGLEDYLEAQYGLDFMDRDFTVAVCGPPISADYFFPKNFTFSDDREHADFFIAFTKDDCHKSLPGTEVYRVERMGALLSIVLDRREIVAGAKRAAPVTAAVSKTK